MSEQRPTPPRSPRSPRSPTWQRTTPGVLPRSVAAAAAKPAAPKPAAVQAATVRPADLRPTAPKRASPKPSHGPREQPPLQEVLKGLDTRELEGETVFDQLFGVLPDADDAVPKA